VNGGYAWGNATLIDVTGYNGPPDFSYRPNGFQGGLHAGVNWQSGALVAGIEGELGYLGLSGSAQYPPYIGIRTAADSVAATSGGVFVSIAGRLGFAINNFLLYAKGGGIWASIGNSFTDTDPVGLTLVSGTTLSGRSGWLAGLGAEVALAGNMIGRMTGHTTTSAPRASTATDNFGGLWTFRHRLTVNSVRVGLSWKM
jgi:outer membrane immunogenic protein